MPNSNSEHLTALYTLRDEITAALSAGKMIKRWKIGSGDDAQEVEYDSPAKALKDVQQQIEAYKQLVAYESNATRSYARFA